MRCRREGSSGVLDVDGTSFFVARQKIKEVGKAVEPHERETIRDLFGLHQLNDLPLGAPHDRARVIKVSGP